MRICLAVGTLLLACGSVFAQSNQTSQTGQSTGMSGMNMKSSQKSQRMSEMRQQMQADMQQMNTQIEKMRADAEKIQDPNTKAAMLDNVDMWDQFAKRMHSHMQMMQGMHEGGMGMHHKKSQSSTGTSTSPQ